MKHIGIVVPSFHIPSETFVVTEINALVNAGHKVSVLTFENLNKCINLNCSVRIIVIKKSTQSAINAALQRPLIALKSSLVARKFTSISVLSLMGYGLNIAEIILKHQISHIHCHFMHAPLAYSIIASKLAGVSVSSIGHGHDVYVNDSDLKLKLSLCDFSVAVCEDMAIKLRKYSAGKIQLLHCGIDLSVFNNKPSRLSESVKLLFVGRLIEKKGLQFLLPAIKKLTKKYSISLDVVGDGPLMNDLKYMCEQLRIDNDVRFLGSKSPVWLSKNTSHYSALVAPFCISENGDRDTGPVVLKEAMASGIPVLTTELMGAKEIVNDAVGFKCEPSSIEGLEKILAKFCELTPYQRHEKGLNAKEVVAKDFNANTQAKKLSNWVQNL
ncbi:glycosyltransferase [Pseudoalteromonas sp. SG45-5]|uniref:glycosyltransferase n=1 Tax=unclassified Pseudoalteromonas TaxID=194690 RepID=UPI0015FB13F6|nr:MULTISPECIES: glycosyltransferase [unclassified Pseudoalteromonas]MBB1385914.1 glycosyltransferase [Pseudoalteromonas sp. SG45-5]MBB1393769.1 glycosyltransferase [Pseudoalteromonas sp. SG44-4]MBB1446627.1 glycosyltransferase [Pseudoalteromonas sp. SG41-6]